jgi:hypothetical protein
MGSAAYRDQPPKRHQTKLSSLTATSCGAQHTMANRNCCNTVHLNYETRPDVTGQLAGRPARKSPWPARRRLTCRQSPPLTSVANSLT